MTCDYLNICKLKVDDDLCNYIFKDCKKRKEYEREKEGKIETQRKNTDSWVIRQLEGERLR